MKPLIVLRKAILYARFLAYKNAPHEQIADLLDAVHNIPELLEYESSIDE